MKRFDSFFNLLIKLEGNAYTNYKNDRGGETKFGITKRIAEAYGYNVKELTEENAKEIYRKEFYDKVKFFEDEELHYNLFDLCVNSGYGTYSACLHSCDTVTKEAVYRYRLDWFNHCAKLKNQEDNLQGWLNRLNMIKDYFNAN